MSVARIDSKKQRNSRTVNGIRTRWVMSKKLRCHETTVVVAISGKSKAAGVLTASSQVHETLAAEGSRLLLRA